MEGMKHFVFVDAACFGEWPWFKVRIPLQAAGHLITTIDMGTTALNAKSFYEIYPLSDLMEPLLKFLASLKADDKVILVGHSYGGISIALAMEKFPQKVSVGVFVSAFMPTYKSSPGALIEEYLNRTPLESLMDCLLKFDHGVDTIQSSICFGPEYMKAKVFKNCTESIVEIANQKVRTTKFCKEDISKGSLLTKERYGSIDRIYVMCGDDEVIEPEFQREMIENDPPKEVFTISGADHMPMLSKVEELSKILEDIAYKY
ncbi:hypothetical protein Pint_28171 [Pistacia integerrima]|uniref:Uncharacterized protein n=1 Tax=Pistacia integerrima TaxID=434235 RepID=A0ACC0YQC0_9ROSI|nr:hypothetical protein Pint_28171 [Pistacia integerrima]